jgi:hypothetical protein
VLLVCFLRPAGQSGVSISSRAPSDHDGDDAMTQRTTEEVLRDHLRLRAAGDLEGDLERNYGDDIALLCKNGVFQGCDAIRASAEILGLQIPGANYEYRSVQTFEESAFLEWRAESDTVRIDDGADSYLIRDGRIRVQTIHYTPVPKR